MGDWRPPLYLALRIFAYGALLATAFWWGFQNAKASWPGAQAACEHQLIQCMERVGVYERFRIGETMEGR